MELIPLGPGFAAEVRGTGLRDVAASDEIYNAVRAAFEEHSVLLFRDQQVTDELQIAFSRKFGPLETAKAASRGEGTPFSILTNVEPDGSLVPPGHKEELRARANQLWHTDSCFKVPPALTSILSGRTVAATGGETEFVSMRLAWERLPADTRRVLDDACAWHDYAHSRGKIAAHLASERERTAMPPVSWRMRWRNPVNGRDALYIASHTCGIEGMARDAALKLIDELMADATQPAYIYQHRWQPGDVIMWDNRATMHRGRPWPLDEPRHMVRTTVSARDADGLATMWPQRTAA
ncbi:MAG: TauD/TfdA family dioxygenase [Betaproteobacteria bacterium]|jgi:alpha-ketoglutarate-dependent 2,4-dichlorophenoxyacetate dioxygenase|nr:TauD/TfdA family dioxygenase [Betaproteobacteria bacterium]MDH4293164.1 TauD/TfdA family dioxygenase [Betaproteobacteria bacterium]MDH5341626.1 TauD/TfdA family dioxygenase [Betaproteobacteria bacterium]